MHILTISDELASAAPTLSALRGAEYDVVHVAGQDPALGDAVHASHLVLLWWREPSVPARRINELRTMRPGVPVIVVQEARTASSVGALNAGADDCVIAPVVMDELLARVRALLRRCAGELDTLTRGPVVINQRTREAWLDGAPMLLNTREFAIFTMLVRRAGTLVTRREILSEVWQRTRAPTSNLIEVYVRHLRTKLGPLAYTLQTVRGKGYVFFPPN